jgi:hypothetical protein
MSPASCPNHAPGFWPAETDNSRSQSLVEPGSDQIAVVPVRLRPQRIPSEPVPWIGAAVGRASLTNLCMIWAGVKPAQGPLAIQRAAAPATTMRYRSGTEALSSTTL